MTDSSTAIKQPEPPDVEPIPAETYLGEPAADDPFIAEYDPDDELNAPTEPISAETAASALKAAEQWREEKEQEKKRKSDTKQPPPLDLLRVEDLYNADDGEMEWLVDGMLSCGGLSLLTSAPKAGKSTLARCLTAAVAQGRDWLGRTVRQGNVLLLSLEDHRRDVREHFKLLHVTTDHPVFMQIGLIDLRYGVPLLHEAMQRTKPVLVVIDTLMRFAKIKDANDYAHVTEALNPVIEMARNTEAHIMLTHHSRKSGGQDGSEALGSTALFGSVDTLLSLKRDGTRRTLYSVQRSGDDLPEMVLDLEDGWVSALGTKEGHDKERVAGAILDYLQTCDGPVKRQDILDNVTGKARNITGALHNLKEADEVQRTGNGARNDPFMFSVPVPAYI